MSINLLEATPKTINAIKQMANCSSPHISSGTVKKDISYKEDIVIPQTGEKYNGAFKIHLQNNIITIFDSFSDLQYTSALRAGKINARGSSGSIYEYTVPKATLSLTQEQIQAKSTLYIYLTITYSSDNYNFTFSKQTSLIDATAGYDNKHVLLVGAIFNGKIICQYFRGAIYNLFLQDW